MRAGAGALAASGLSGGGQHLSHLLTTIIRHQLSPGPLMLAGSTQSWAHPTAAQASDYSGTRISNHHQHTSYDSQKPQPQPISAQLVATITDQEQQTPIADTSNKLQLELQLQRTIHGAQVAASSSTAALTGTAGGGGGGGDWWRDYWSRQPFPSGYTQSSITLLACLITTIIFLIVVGNLLVCIAIFTEKSLKPTQNWFIASLAVSDMLLGLVVMPFSLARELMGFWIFGTLWCDIHEAIDVLLTTASINTLCLISLDRYWSITQAVSYLKKRTPRRGAFMIAFVWIFSAAVSLPPLFGWKKPNPYIVAAPPELDNSSLLINSPGAQIEDVSGGSGMDVEMSTTSMGLPVPTQAPAEYPMCQLSDDVGYVLYSALGSFFLPCAVMVFTYIKIFLAARSRARRAINKQTRTGIGANKRSGGARRSQATIQGTIDSNKPQQPTSEAAARNPSIGAVQQGEQTRKIVGEKQFCSPEPPIKGKIVVVERRKSMAVVQSGARGLPVAHADQSAGIKAVCSTFSLAAAIKENRTNRATYTCSELMAEQGLGCVQFESGADSLDDSARLVGGHSSATLTTSDAKVASRSVLNSSISNDSSMITVMNASMIEMPVTHFNFNSSTTSPDQMNGDQLDKQSQELTHQQGTADPGGSRSSLLDGLRNASEQQQVASAISGTETIPSLVPQIVVDEKRSFERSEKQSFEFTQNTIQSLNQATNETCFMTMEEDSDIFDAQAGRTVVMMGLNRTTTMNANDILCNSLTCRTPRQHTHSASSYCGSSLTINEDDDLDDCVDDELMTDECNGLSISCGLDQYSSCIHCQDCDRERGGEVSGSMGGGGQMCYNRGLNQLSPSRLAADSPTTRTHAESGLARRHRPHECYHHHAGYDDNFSMNEYKSNDDSSSFIGHDVLDATERLTSPSKKKPSIIASATEKSGGVASSLVGYLAERKRSTIGNRLSRLGSNAPLSNEAGGLLDLASRGQTGANAGGSRNLKALRQNFFMKLNQLTAKSSVKINKTKPKNIDQSVSGVHSSESCEASVDCATTSNVHSAEYQQETTTNDEIHSGVKDSSSRGGQETEEFAGRRDKQFQEADGRYSSAGVRGINDAVGNRSEKLQRFGPTDSGHISNNNNNNQDDERTIDKSDDRSVMLRDPKDNITKLRGHPIDLNNSKLPPTNTTRAGNKSGNSGSVDPKKKLSLKQNGFKKGSSSYQMNHTSGSGSNALPSPGAAVGGGSQTSRAYLASDNERHKRKLAKARERRATLILGLIMAAFICSWMPFFTFYVIRAVCVDCREYMNPRFEAFIFWMGYCNSAINPIIYTIFNRDFRKAFRKIVFKCL